MKLFENVHTSSISDAKQTMKFIFIRSEKATKLGTTLENLRRLYKGWATKSGSCTATINNLLCFKPKKVTK